MPTPTRAVVPRQRTAGQILEWLFEGSKSTSALNEIVEHLIRFVDLIY